jgi:hypothetical protein
MYAAIFAHADPELGQRKLISVPEAIEAKTPEEAKKEGLLVLNDLAPEHREIMKPLSIVELSEEMFFSIANCERIHLPMAGEDGLNDDELEFVDVSNAVYWQNQPWWSR